MQFDVHPTPTDEEAAAIVAAVEALWPKPVGARPAQRAANAGVAVQRPLVAARPHGARRPPLALTGAAVAVELTTVADDLAVGARRAVVRRYEGLAARHRYEFDGVAGAHAAPAAGRAAGRVATVNDVHFGETECGRIDDHSDGPIIRQGPSEPPYPETMNRAAVAEIAAIAPDAVVVKGDLSQDGTDDEWAAFEACYRVAFGDRLLVVRGNHDAYRGQDAYAGDRWITVPGLHVALLDTAIPTVTTGGLRADQLDWLDEHLAAAAGERAIVMGHHQQWIAGGRPRAPERRVLRAPPRCQRRARRGVRAARRPCSGTRPVTPTATGCGG